MKFHPPVFSEEQRGVYHNQDECPDYLKITKENKQVYKGTSRVLCSRCQKIAEYNHRKE